MNFIALILFIVAAVVFFLVPDARLTRYGRSSVALGLGILTVGFIVQFCSTHHSVTF